ncbi:MAG: radical SAM protein [Myxococcota bacterium]
MRSGGLLQLGRRANASPLLSEEEAQRWRDLRPRFAHVYVENKCHLRCAHCYESEETHPTHLRLRLDQYEGIFRGLANLGVLVLTFSGGEPFLRRDFLDIVALARRMRFAARVYTSGTHIDERKADRLRELRVTEVHISIYSHESSVHDGFTGVPGSFDRSVRAIRLLRERQIPVTMKTNVLTFNVDHLDDLVHFAQQLDASVLFGPDLWARNNGDVAPLQYRVSAQELARKVFSRLDLERRFLPLAGGEECSGEAKWDVDKSPCAAASRIITVGADGNIYPCTMFTTAGGNIAQQSIEDIWYRSRVFDRIRRTTLGDFNDCPSCDLREACHPCMAYGEIEHGDHRACNSTSRNSAEAVDLLAQRRANAQRKMATGRCLPIVADTVAPLPHAHGVVLGGEEFL